jgi:hypothetical protein
VHMHMRRYTNTHVYIKIYMLLMYVQRCSSMLLCIHAVLEVYIYTHIV